jgi:hypothetical protein
MTRYLSVSNVTDVPWNLHPNTWYWSNAATDQWQWQDAEHQSFRATLLALHAWISETECLLHRVVTGIISAVVDVQQHKLSARPLSPQESINAMILGLRVQAHGLLDNAR